MKINQKYNGAGRWSRFRAFLQRVFSPSDSKPSIDFLKAKAGGEIEYVFEAGGKRYYKYINEQKIPPMRAFAALDFYAALNYRLDRDYLEGLFAAIVDGLNKQEYTQIGVLVHYANQRLKHITNIDLIYQLGSVLYFDETENPADFDLVYAYEKINHWKKEQVGAFFLRTPLADFLPYSDISTENIQAIARDQSKSEITQLTALIQILSEKEQNSELVMRLRSRVRTLENIII